MPSKNVVDAEWAILSALVSQRCIDASSAPISLLGRPLIPPGLIAHPKAFNRR